MPNFKLQQALLYLWGNKNISTNKIKYTLDRKEVFFLCLFNDWSSLTCRCRSKGSQRAATPRQRLEKIKSLSRSQHYLTMVNVPQRQTPHQPREVSRPSPPINPTKNQSHQKQNFSQEADVQKEGFLPGGESQDQVRMI